MREEHAEGKLKNGLRMNIEVIATKIVDAAIKVHTLGFLLNWNVPRMKEGIKRMVNNL